MAGKDDMDVAQEQVARRRLSRMLDVLPVFSGYISPDGHLSRTRPETDASFLWSLPAFSYAHDSVTQIVDLCETAAQGERIQVERPYQDGSAEGSTSFRDGLLTLTPILDENNYIDEIAVSLIDCADVGVTPVDEFAKSRLFQANQRISTMLALAQTVIEASQSEDIEQADDRSKLTQRLDVLANMIDLASQLDVTHIPLKTLIETTLTVLPERIGEYSFKTELNNAVIPITQSPLISLLLSELFDNALEHGAWRNGPNDRIGTITLQAEVLDSAYGKSLHMHWIEDQGPSVSGVLDRGFGFMLAERLFPQLTDGDARLLNSEEGISWSFSCPTEDDTSNTLAEEMM